MSDQWRFLITNMDGAEFAEDRNAATVRLLRDVADRIERDGATHGYLKDINGNTVGDYGGKRDEDRPLP